MSARKVAHLVQNDLLVSVWEQSGDGVSLLNAVSGDLRLELCMQLLSLEVNDAPEQLVHDWVRLRVRTGHA